MKKVIPIITIILSIVALVAAGFGLFFSCIVLIEDSVIDVLFVAFTLAFTMPAFTLSAINTCLSFVFVKNKACLVAGIISAVALIVSIVIFVLLRIDGYRLIQVLTESV